MCLMTEVNSETPSIYHGKTCTERGKKAWGELNMDAVCRFEDILEATPDKIAAVRQLTSYLTNHP